MMIKIDAFIREEKFEDVWDVESSEDIKRL